MILDRNGRLNLFSIDADKHRVYTAKIRASYQTGPYLANPPPMSYNPGPNKKIFQTRFDQLLNKLQIDPAKKLLIEAPQQVLQDADNIEKLRAAMDNFGHQSLEDYVELDKLEIKCIEREIKNKRFLGEEDSMRYCKLIFKMKPKDEAFKEIELHLRNVILLNCEKLGDLFMENLFFKGACSVYYRTKSHNKCIQCMIMMDDTEKIIKYCESVNYSPDWQKLLTDISIPKTNGIKDFIQTLIDKQYLPADYINL